MPFKSKIALASGGSNSPQLQGDSTVEPTILAKVDKESCAQNEETDVKATDDVMIDRVIAKVDEGSSAKDEEVDFRVKRTAVVDPERAIRAQIKKERFQQSIARDAGEILETIDHDALTAVADEVAWDQEPELLCSYNWKASDDDTNAIFRE